MFEEKRITPRYTISQIVEINLEEETYFAAEGIDISVTGLSFKTSYAVMPGAKIFIIIDISLGKEENRIKINSQAVYENKENGYYRVGIKFLDLKEYDKKIIEDYIKNIESSGQI